MTQNLYQNGTRRLNISDSTRFSGLICNSDFNTEHRGNDTYSSSIASRIASDWNFDEQCRKNIEIRNARKTFKERN